MGMFGGKEVVFALQNSSSDTEKSCLVVEQLDVCLAAVVKLPGVLYASLDRGPLLDEDFPVDIQAS